MNVLIEAARIQQEISERVDETDADYAEIIEAAQKRFSPNCASNADHSCL